MGGSSVGRSLRAEQNISRRIVAGVGTVEVMPAVLGCRLAVVGGLLTLSADGTLRFASDSGDLTGAWDVAAKGGFAIPQDDVPLVVAPEGETLQIITTDGQVNGVVLVEILE